MGMKMCKYEYFFSLAHLTEELHPNFMVPARNSVAVEAVAKLVCAVIVASIVCNVLLSPLVQKCAEDRLQID